MTKPRYVRSKRGHIWHLREWQDVKDGPRVPHVWVYCDSSAWFTESTESPGRVCKRCLTTARKAADYLEAALADEARGESAEMDKQCS